MKKILALFLVSLMLFSIVACANKDTDNPDEETNKTETTEAPKPKELITSGRISAMKPSDKWVMKDPSAWDEDSLMYYLKPENWDGKSFIDCKSFQLSAVKKTVKEAVDRQIEIDKDIYDYTQVVATIGKTEFTILKSDNSLTDLMYADKGGQTLVVLFDNRLELTDPEIIEIIDSVVITPAK